MNAFIAYADANRLSGTGEPLDIIKRDDRYIVYHGSVALRTPGGNEFCFETERMACLMATDLMTGGDPHRLAAPLLFAFQRDVFDKEGDPLLGSWGRILSVDPFVTLKTTGSFGSKPYDPEHPLFPVAFIILSGLIRSVNGFVSSAMGEVVLEENDQHPFPALLRSGYSGLSPAEKVVVQALGGWHHSGVVMPFLLLSGFISPLEYTRGLVAMRIRQKEQAREILLDVARARDYLECLGQPAAMARHTALIIREGENETVEFKSTLRWDIRAGKTNPAVERACLKTIAAFLNSDGGTLLIGVRDDGSVEGIESDKFVNDDKFLLHLWTLIRTSMGTDVSPYIRTILEKTGERTVCVVQVIRSNRPVFLRQPGFDEEFFIRVGPSTNAMDISEALKYIADRFYTSTK
jgi:hypothetical protein